MTNSIKTDAGSNSQEDSWGKMANEVISNTNAANEANKASSERAMDDANANGALSDSSLLNATKKPKWPWVVVVIALGLLIVIIVMLLIWQPWAEEEHHTGKPSGASNSTTVDTSGGTATIAEDMRRTCSDKMTQSTEAPRIVQGRISTSSAATDPDYLLICDWGIGIQMDDGLDIAFSAEAEKVGFTAITVDTEYYQQNRFSRKIDAPEFFSGILKDGSGDAAMMTLQRVSEREYQAMVDECDGNDICLGMLDAYVSPFLKYDGYVYIKNWTQAYRSSCEAAQQSTGIVLTAQGVACPEMRWEEESLERLRNWARDEAWITF